MTIPGPTDLDKSGNFFQSQRVYMGPSLGWVNRMPWKAQLIEATGSSEVEGGVGIVYVNVAAVVTILLPDIREWLKQCVQYGANSYETSIYIKDLGYHSGTFAITVTPYSTQTIDGFSTRSIEQDGQMIELIPLNDLSGWILKW